MAMKGHFSHRIVQVRADHASFSYSINKLTCKFFCVFAARCCAERGYVIVSRTSVCPSVCLSVRGIQVCFSHRLEYFRRPTNFTAA